MSTFSREYWRGVSAAYECLYEGESVDTLKGQAAASYYFSSLTDFDHGWNAQLKAWPVKILVPEELAPRTTNIACAVFAGLALLGFGVLVLGFPKLSGPAAGGIAVAVVIFLIGAYRNMR